MTNVPIPEVCIGEPMQCGNVAVFPLFTGLPVSTGTLDYVLASEAMATGTMTVQEVSETGEVPCLLVHNGGDRPALFIEGDEVRGGKQNRVLCNSILAAGTSPTRIPVACIESRRWEYDSRQFTSGSRCPPSLRYFLKEGSNGRQSRIWATIRRQHLRLGVRSQTENLSDALEMHGERVAELRGKLPYAEDASGIAVALGGKVVGIDIFDKPATCKAVWERFMESLLLDAVDLPDTQRRASISNLAVKLYWMKNMRWQQVDSVGLGEAYRARDDDTLATALVVDETLLHLSVSMPI